MWGCGCVWRGGELEGTMSNATPGKTQVKTLWLVILAILLPPVAVWLKAGIGLHLIISIVLTLLFYVPGLIHALWVILR